MIILNILIELVGQSFVFNATNASNFNDIVNQVTEEPCSVTIEYNGVTYTGSGMRVGNEIIVTMDSPVILPTGMCINFDCAQSPPVNERDCVDTEIAYDPELRLAILDDEGCLRGWILLSDIINHIIPDDPQTLCEALNIPEVPEGDLVAQDRILTVGPNCEIKSIPVTDIVCD